MSLEGIQNRVTKQIKIVKDYSYWERLKKLRLKALLERRMKGDIIKTFKIINTIHNYDGCLFNISP